MSQILPNKISLQNDSASITIEPFGGAITAFKLNGFDINPLNFAFTNQQMPANNKAGAPYQGHFACIGRWGEPTKGEIQCGIPNHGEPANLPWTVSESEPTKLKMHIAALKEGLHVDRTLILHKHEPIFLVKEEVTNINAFGRLYNIVQHPTLAAPFLDDKTIVDCNATRGFNQLKYDDIL